MTPRAKLCAGLCLGATLLAAGASAAHNADQPPAQPNAPQANLEPTKIYYGVQVCAQCHDRTEPFPVGKFPSLCDGMECRIWSKDKHHLAYQALKGERAQQMTKLLGSDVAKMDACLSCHSVRRNPKDSSDPTFDQEEGISCVACHGAYENWIDEHGSSLQRKRDRWRSLSRAVKQDDYGMTDLWDPAKRTQLCASCHIGNAKDGKFVTHEMYAAGHPPLPSFEVATFSAQMPRHWKPLKEKHAAILEKLDLTPTAVRFEDTRLLAVGSVVTLQETAKLLELKALDCSPPEKGQGSALDFAVFDCYACHHDLKLPSWRQARGYAGAPPGRPPMRPWPTALARVCLTALTRDQTFSSQLDVGLAELRQAFGARPFGDCARIATTAQGLYSQMDHAARPLNPWSNYTRHSARRLLLDLCAAGQGTEIPDFDSARQIGWALRVVYAEWRQSDKSDGEVVALLQAISDQLSLDLPAKNPGPIMDALEQNLNKIAGYDPAQFKAKLAQLAEYFKRNEP
jgi:hypothetical protein